jgi:hypothetical protein
MATAQQINATYWPSKIFNALQRTIEGRDETDL